MQALGRQVPAQVCLHEVETQRTAHAGIWGGKGQGKTFQCTLAYKKLDISPIVMSAGELESGNAGEPAKLIRQRYREVRPLSLQLLRVLLKLPVLAVWLYASVSLLDTKWRLEVEEALWSACFCTGAPLQGNCWCKSLVPSDRANLNCGSQASAFSERRQPKLLLRISDPACQCSRQTS